MATITRFFFTRYKEVSYQTPSGQFSDDPYGSFSLDNPSQTSSGTIDFFGVMETKHLLGDLQRVTIDTGNVSLIQYDTLSSQEIDQRIASGQFQVTDQRIGWVDLGKATPSFFYNDCNVFSQSSPDGKRPVVNYFYDISQLGIDGNIVSGDPNSTVGQFLTGTPLVPELQVVGTYNVNETNLSWGPYPTIRYTNPSFQGDDIRQFGVNFQYYIERVINGSSWPSRAGQIQSGTALNVLSSNNTQLLLANKDDHFNNPNFQKDVLGRYGEVRRTMISGFRSPSQSSVGQCLPIISPGVTPPTTVVGAGGPIVTSPGRGDVSIGGDRAPTTRTIIESEYTEKCFEDMSFDFNSIEGIVSVAPDKFGAIIISQEPNDYIDLFSYQVSNNFSHQATRQTYQYIDSLYNIRDPREPFGDNINNPKGIYRAYVTEDCQTKIFPAYLKKDGDIPELIGPLRANSVEQYRKFLKDDIGYHYKSLRFIGNDYSGFPQFSDGKSFIELATTSAYGGSLFSIAINGNREYGDRQWNSIRDILISAKADAIKYVNGERNDLQILLPPTTYRYLYDNHSIPIVIRSKSGRNRLMRQPLDSIFLGFNDRKNYNFSDVESLLKSLSKDDSIDYESVTINKNRSLQYGKNPIISLVSNYKLNIFNTQQFPNPTLKVDNFGNLFVELIDQTYLLDIYMSLMTLHLTGYSWELIIEFMQEYGKILSGSSVVNRRRRGISVNIGSITSLPYLTDQLYNKILQVPYLKNNILI